MKDFQRIIDRIRHLQAVAILGHDPEVRRQQLTAIYTPPKPQVTPYELALFQTFYPSFYVSAGERTARLDKVQVYDNGKKVGFYSIVCRNPRTGLQERYAWRYVLRNGVIELDKAYPVTSR